MLLGDDGHEKGFIRYLREPRFELIKAGVMLLDLVPGSLYQGELDLEPEVTGERLKLMATMDALNTKYGKGMVRLASRRIDDYTWTGACANSV